MLISLSLSRSRSFSLHPLSIHRHIQKYTGSLKCFRHFSVSIFTRISIFISNFGFSLFAPNSVIINGLYAHIFTSIGTTPEAAIYSQYHQIERDDFLLFYLSNKLKLRLSITFFLSHLQLVYLVQQVNIFLFLSLAKIFS